MTKKMLNTWYHSSLIPIILASHHPCHPKSLVSLILVRLNLGTLHPWYLSPLVPLMVPPLLCWPSSTVRLIPSTTHLWRPLVWYLTSMICLPFVSSSHWQPTRPLGILYAWSSGQMILLPIGIPHLWYHPRPPPHS
jgi:hypothetical protein